MNTKVIIFAALLAAQTVHADVLCQNKEGSFIFSPKASGWNLVKEEKGELVTKQTYQDGNGTKLTLATVIGCGPTTGFCGSDPFPYPYPQPEPQPQPKPTPKPQPSKAAKVVTADGQEATYSCEAL